MINHKDDLAFRSLLLGSVTSEERNVQQILTDLIERQGYKATVKDVQGMRNGSNPTSILIHRVNVQLWWLWNEGAIEITKTNGRKGYRLKDKE
jgi:hypothetical protein